MDHISRVLPRVLQKRGIGEHAQAALTVFRAQQWLAEHLPHLRSALHASRVEDGILRIECDHPIAVQECQQSVPALLSHLGKECGGVTKEVRVVRKH